MTWLQETTAGSIALSRGFGSAGVGGIFAQGLSVSDISNVPEETIDAESDLAVGLAWSRNIWGDLDAGFAPKLVRSKLAGESATGASFDFGLNYRLVEEWDIALALRDWGSAMAYGDAPEDQLPTQFALGAAGVIRDIRWGSDLQWENGRGWDGGVGAEYVWRDLLAARAGSRVDADPSDAMEPWSAGLGVNVGKGVSIDYSFRDGVLDPNHRVSISWTGADGKTVSTQESPALSAQEFYLASLNEALDQAMANFPKEKIVDTVGVRPKAANDADSLVSAALERRLRALGYEVEIFKPLLVAPDDYDDPKTAKEVEERVRKANAKALAREVTLEYELKTSTYSIDRRKRRRLVGPLSFERSARIEIDLRLLKTGETESLWSGSGSAARSETVAARRVPASTGYPAAGGAAVESRRLHPLVEPAIVGGIVTGLVLIFFSNRDVGE
jgi:hypothetical protein